MPDYTKEHGTTFVDVLTGESKHTYRDFGLYPSEVNMPSPPGVQTQFIEIPGMDGTLDATEALDGNVHYEDRDYEQKYVDLNGRARWHTRYSEILNFIHGKQLRMILDDDPEWFYVGRFELDDPAPKNYKNTLEITATLKPYKYAINSTLDDWLWDPFSFENGIIREYKDIAVDNSTTITIVGSSMPVVPAITVASEDESGLDLVYNGETYHLSDGVNRIVTMTLTAGEHQLTFIGIGLVSIDFREGSL